VNKDAALAEFQNVAAALFFGVGGPNATSSFHVIGEIFDRVYNQAAIGSPMATNVQTTTVGPGGATMVEFKLEVPGRYILVDHALSRLERGLAGFLIVEGAENPTIFHSGGLPSMSGH
jgi:nitrite reductase (NO-forming)